MEFMLYKCECPEQADLKGQNNACWFPRLERGEKRVELMDTQIFGEEEIKCNCGNVLQPFVNVLKIATLCKCFRKWI